MKVAPPPADPLLARFAQHQWGLVTRAQLQQLGLSDKGIAARVRTLRLHRIHRGVYAVGHRVLRQEAKWLAAVLACGGGAVLSHASAAVLWELRAVIPAIVDVTVPSRSGRAKRRGIRLHRSAHLDRTEIVVRDGIPVTTVARTLLDLADVLPTHALKRAIDEAEYRGRLDLTSLSAVVHNNPRRRGGLVLALAEGPPALTRSQLEERFLAFCRRHDLPAPEVGAGVEGYEVDFLFTDARLIVETDGLAAHRTRRAMERDRIRDRRTLVAGFHTVRLTERAIRADELAVARDLRALLRRRRGASEPRPETAAS
jgi:hypothetical protein